MKAFVVAALLVASVAGQSMDMGNWKVRDTSLFKPSIKSSVEDLLMKEKLGGHWNMNSWNMKNTWDSNSMDWTPKMWGETDVTVLSIDELMSHPVFRQYMHIPLFRTFWEQYPVVFRRYVESPLFQQFWMVPEFVQYFRNPVLFYKYIVPQVQFISKTMVPTTEEGTFDYGTTPMSTPFSRYTPYGYKYTPYNREWSTPMTWGRMHHTMNPYTMSTSNYNMPTTYYKYLLEKMMRHLKVNTMGENTITETLTDVMMTPNGHIKEQTMGKIVDPITGMEKITLGDIKVVDEKIVPRNFPYGVETTYPKYGMDKMIFGTHNTETIKDLLLKHIILTKLFGERKHMLTPEVYETLFGEHNMLFKHKSLMTPENLETIFGHKKMMYTPEMYETLFDTKKTIHPEMFQTLWGEEKMHTLTPEMLEFLINGKRKSEIMTPEMLETVFGKKIYTPEVYSTLFGEKVMTPTWMPEEIESEYPIYNRNKYWSPMVSRMMKNHRFSPKMDVMKFKTEKMFEDMKKEKMMEEMIKTHTMESELPKIMETEKMMKHIPLTYTKPNFVNEMEDIKF